MIAVLATDIVRRVNRQKMLCLFVGALGNALPVALPSALAVEWSTSRSMTTQLGYYTEQRSDETEFSSIPVFLLIPQWSLYGQARQSSTRLTLGAEYIKFLAESDSAVAPLARLDVDLNPATGPFSLQGSAMLSSQISSEASLAESLNSSGDSVIGIRTLELRPALAQDINPSLQLYSSALLRSITTDSEQLQDSSTHSLDLGLRSGSASRQGFTWSTNAGASQQHIDDGDEINTQAVDVGFALPLSTQFQLTASVGRERREIERPLDNSAAVAIDDERASRTNNVWDLGLIWAPGPRTSVLASYGQRVFGRNPSLNIQHRTRRSTLQANWSRSESRALPQRSLLDGNRFITDAGALDSDNPDTGVSGEPLLDTNDILTNRLAVQERIAASYSLQGRVSAANIALAFTTREQQDDLPRTDVWTTSLGFERRINQRWDWRLEYEVSERGGSGTTPDVDTQQVAIIFRYESGSRR